MLAQFVRYAAAGAAGTVVQYLLLMALIEAGGVRPVLASTWGAVAGAFLNYLLNYRYTFRSSRPHAVAFVKYFTVTAAGIVLNAIVLAAAMSLLGFAYLPAQVLATAVVLLAAFTTNRAWTF